MTNQFVRQLTSLTLANMKARYRKTIAGFIWVILNPIILYSVQSVVFRKILKIEMPDYGLFLLGGLLPWIFITSTMEMSIPYLFQAHDLLKSFRINPFLLVLSQVLDNFFNFVVAFFIIFIPFVTFSVNFDHHQSALYLLPLPIGLLFLAVSSLSATLSLINIFYRDTKFIFGFVMNIMYFITPIFYPIDFVPENYRWVIQINPLYYLVESFRSALYQYDSGFFWLSLGKAAIITALFVLLSALYWKKRKNDLYHYI